MKDVIRIKNRSEAEAYCSRLQFEGFDAVVEVDGSRSHYGFYIKIPDEQYPDFIKDDYLPTAEENTPTVLCPHCESTSVKKVEVGCAGTFLLIPCLIFMINQKRSGYLYTCNECKEKFRFQLYDQIDT